MNWRGTTALPVGQWRGVPFWPQHTVDLIQSVSCGSASLARMHDAQIWATLRDTVELAGAQVSRSMSVAHYPVKLTPHPKYMFARDYRGRSRGLFSHFSSMISREPRQSSSCTGPVTHCTDVKAKRERPSSCACTTIRHMAKRRSPRQSMTAHASASFERPLMHRPTLIHSTRICPLPLHNLPLIMALYAQAPGPLMADTSAPIEQ